MSKSLGSSVQVGRVSYRIPASIRIEDFYVEDQQQDTLFYAHEVYARLKPKALLRNEVRFYKIMVDGAYINIHDRNYDFLTPLFASSSDTVSTTISPLIAAPEVDITNTRVHVDDYQIDLQALNLHLREFSKDTFFLEVDELNGQYTYLPYLKQGAQPLVIQDLDTRIQICNRFAQLPYLNLRLPNSALVIENLSLHFPEELYNAKGSDTFDYVSAAPYVTADMVLDRLNIYPPDLAMIHPSLKQFHSRVLMHGELTGTLDSLYVRDLQLKYNKQSVLKGDIYVNGLPDYNNAFIRATCRDFYVNAGMVQDIISDIEQSPFRLPASINNLGQVHYRGQITGTLHHLALKGAFRTAQGVVSTDGRVHMSDDWKELIFNGGVATTNFHLGHVIETDKVGDISLNVTTDLCLRNDRLDAQATLVIDSVSLLNETYYNLQIKGQTSPLGFSGSMLIHDPDLSFVAGFNHNKDSLLTTNSSFFIDSLFIRYGADSIYMKELDFSHIAQADGTKTVKLTSDYIAGALVGDVDYGTLLTTFQKLLIHYLPSLYSKQDRQRILSCPSNNNFRFYLYGRELKRLQRALKLPIRISDYPVMKGYISEADNQWVMQGYVPYLLKDKSKYEDITFSSDNLADRANVSLSTKSAFTQLVLHSFAQEDSCHVALRVRNIDPSRTDSDASAIRNYDIWKKMSSQIDFIEGDLDLTASFTQYAGYPLMEVHLYPSFLQYGDSLYNINDAHLTYSVADTLLTVDHFRVGTNTQFIEANGIGSTNPNDRLSVQLGQLQAAHLMQFALPEKTLTVQGDITGWANLYGLFSHPAFEADIKLDSAGMNGYYIGDAVAKLTLDKENYNILIDADVTENNHLVAHVDGLVEPAKNHWGINIYPDSFSTAFINHWPNGYITDISGRTSGKVTVSGQGAKTWVNAAVYADSIGITIPYTGCRYMVTDSVFLDSTSIRFPHLTLHDEEGNELYFDGVLGHSDYFTDFTFDLLARPNHTLVFDLPYQRGEMLSGKTYATGEVRVSGDEKDISLTANALASNQSQFRFNVGYAYSASSSDFITFYDHHLEAAKLLKQEDEEELEDVEIAGPGSRFKMALNIEVDPSLDFYLVLNEATGDEILANGDGAFTVGYDDKTGEVSMVGTYSIAKGTMGFTLGNILRRDFTIAEGSTIVWSGNAENPSLNVTANYTVSASLKDLFGSDVSSITTSRTTIPVTTSISLTGTLDNPQIRFALSLPRSEQEIEDKVRAVINTEEMLMRQVVYLLVFGRFFTPEFMVSTASTFDANAMYALLSSTVTTQINQWLSKLTDVFTMGLNLRKEGDGAQSSYEAEAKFQLQPIDRLVINGNLGYRYNDITNRPFFGDVDVEYLLTQNGKVRIKAYTHTVDKYSLRQASTIQGVGFVFKHDFNWVKPKKNKTLSPTEKRAKQ